ncbi:uncharacterized protein LOC106013497 [Aplysia californica]|uniref:Uncharacterized protein LOC106013497 n=1 Tax=Aplysia californica TaxID=6500 RepID=A0ABM1AC27_APLCA|nr:uncharacterized protein LOC106013497 [Aplysia californica]
MENSMVSPPTPILDNTTRSVAEVEPAGNFAHQTSHSFMIDTQVYKSLGLYFSSITSLLLASLGCGNNVLIILVFAKQGFGESVNISMTAIAVWDLVKCLTGAICRLYGPIGMVSAANGFSWQMMTVPNLGYLNTISGYVSFGLAAYVSFERCVCVVKPFTVKSLLTPKVTITAVTFVSVTMFGSFAISLTQYKVVWVFSPRFNTTVAVYGVTDFFSRHAERILEYYRAASVAVPVITYTVIVTCTIIIMVQLREYSKFRIQSQAGAKKPNQPPPTTEYALKNTTKDSSKPPAKGKGKGAAALSTRDRQVVRMLLAVLFVYIVNLVPRLAMYVAMFAEPEFYFDRRYHRLYMVVLGFIHFGEILNASVNLYIFLAMSSQFRNTFLLLFPSSQICVSLCQGKLSP